MNIQRADTPSRASGPVPSGDDGERSRASQRVAIAACAVLSASPLIAAAWTARTGAPRLDFSTDQALIEIAVRHAADFTQTLGPYSRFLFAHPGPLWFYLLAPFYVLGGRTASSLNASQDLLNALTCIAIVGAAARKQVVQAFGTAVVILAAIATAPIGVFAGLWNPYALVLPTLLFLVLIARGAAGGPWWFAGAVVPACFLTQTHAGTIPFVGLIVIVGVALAVVRHRNLSPAGRPALRSYAWPAAAGLLGALVLWLPPLIQQLTSRQGNLGLVLKFFLSPGSRTGTQITAASRISGHSWNEAATLVGRLLASPLHGNQSIGSTLTGQNATQAWLVMCAFALSCTAAAAYAARRRDLFAAGLAVLALAGATVALWSATTVAGPLLYYLEYWVIAIPAALALSVVQLLAPRWSAPARSALRRLSRSGDHAWAAVAGVSGCALAIAVGVPLTAQTRSIANQPDLGVTSAMSRMTAAIGRPTTANEVVRVELDQSDLWPLATAAADHLDSLGWTATLPQAWAIVFDQPQALSDNTLPTVWLKLGTEPRAPTGCQVVKKLVSSSEVNSQSTRTLLTGETAVIYTCPDGTR